MSIIKGHVCLFLTGVKENRIQSVASFDPSDLTCFIQMLQWRATESPMLAMTRLLLTELSSNLGSTLLAATTGSRAPGAKLRLSPIIGRVVWAGDILGPIMGSITPENSIEKEIFAWWKPSRHLADYKELRHVSDLSCFPLQLCWYSGFFFQVVYTGILTLTVNSCEANFPSVILPH